MDYSMPGLPVHHQLPEFIQTHVHWVEDAIQPSHPLLSPSPAFDLSQHQALFQWISWPKYWSFSFSISPSNEYSGLISSRVDWLDLLAVQGTLKSLLHHHSSKASDGQLGIYQIFMFAKIRKLLHTYICAYMQAFFWATCLEMGLLGQKVCTLRWIHTNWLLKMLF